MTSCELRTLIREVISEALLPTHKGVMMPLENMIVIRPSHAKDPDVMRYILERHYLREFPPSMKVIYKIYFKYPNGVERSVGCCIFGYGWYQKSLLKMPDSSKISPSDLDDIASGKIRLEELNIPFKQIMDLKRFYTQPKIMNLESKSLKLCLEKLKEDRPDIKAVTTYSWETAGHVGGIYQALGAYYLGKNKTTDMFKYFFIQNGVNDRTKKFVEKYFHVKPYPKAKDIKPKVWDVGKKDIIKIRGMQLSMYKKQYETLFKQKLSDEQIQNYEERVANTILKTKSHRHLKESFDIFVWIFSEILHKRSHIVERSILERNFSTATTQPSRNTKYNRWPIMDGVIKYVKEVMGGEWPEFEEKLTKSPYNLEYYYNNMDIETQEPTVDDNPSISTIGVKPEVPMI